jgi:hypothetical protein
MSLRSLEPADLDAYNDHLLTSGLSLSHLAQRRHAARLLWIYAGKLTSDALTFDPRALPGLGCRAVQPGRRELHAPHPRAGDRPAADMALTWINELADDILAAFEEWRLLHANTQLNRRRRNAPPSGNIAGKLEQLLQRYRAERRPLPGGPDGKPVRAHLAREIGCTPGAFGHRAARNFSPARRQNSGSPTMPTYAPRSPGGSAAHHGLARSPTPRPSIWPGCCRQPHG